MHFLRLINDYSMPLKLSIFNEDLCMPSYEIDKILININHIVSIERMSYGEYTKYHQVVIRLVNVKSVSINFNSVKDRDIFFCFIVEKLSDLTTIIHVK